VRDRKGTGEDENSGGLPTKNGLKIKGGEKPEAWGVRGKRMGGILLVKRVMKKEQG